MIYLRLRLAEKHVRPILEARVGMPRGGRPEHTLRKGADVPQTKGRIIVTVIVMIVVTIIVIIIAIVVTIIVIGGPRSPRPGIRRLALRGSAAETTTTTTTTTTTNNNNNNTTNNKNDNNNDNNNNNLARESFLRGAPR